jgi:putative transposase
MEKLQPNSSYHIFNHANGFENIFTDDENYRFFLDKYKQYITPIAETYAYCMLPNHFHLVVRIRRKEVIEELIRNKNNFPKVSFDFEKVREEVNISNDDIEKYLSKQFSNFFSCYTQSFNRMYKRMGSLFIKNFKREIILDKEYFMNAVVYTHRNPIHHGFCKRYSDWSYTSYCEISERKSEVVDVNKLLAVFKSKEFFIDSHKQNLDKFNQSTELEAP